jgi:hypothetical protein
LGSLGSARSAQQNIWKFCSQRKECAYEPLTEFREGCARRAHQRIYKLMETLKVTEHLRGRTVQRRAQREDKIVEDSVKLFQEGIEQVQGVHQGTLF